jgi:hypothetical protein
MDLPSAFTPTTIDGKNFSANTTFVTFPLLPSPNVSHPHMVLEYGEEVLVPDLVSVVLYLFWSIWASTVSDLRWSSAF